MFVEFSARFLNGLIRATTRRRGSHDFADAYVRPSPVIGGHAATDVALGDDADHLAVFCVLDDRRAATA